MAGVDGRGHSVSCVPCVVSPPLAICSQVLDAAFSDFHPAEAVFDAVMQQPEDPDLMVVKRYRVATALARNALAALILYPSAGVQGSLFKIRVLEPLAPLIDTTFDLAPLVCNTLLPELAAALPIPEPSRPQTPSRKLGGLLPRSFRFKSRSVAVRLTRGL